MDEGENAAFVMQLDRFRIAVARIGEMQTHAGIEEGQLAQPVFQGREVEFDLGEGLARHHEGDFRAGTVRVVLDRRRTDDLERRLGLAVLEAHDMLVAAAPDAQFEPLRQRVDHRNADAVQTARDLVGVLVELTAGVELGHDDLGRRHALFLVDVDRNAATVVAHGDRTVAVERHVDPVGEAGQRFVDGVVDHFVDHMVQARAVIGVADIHARALAHGVEPAQHLDGVGAVFLGRLVGGGVVLRNLTSHRYLRPSTSCRLKPALLHRHRDGKSAPGHRTARRRPRRFRSTSSGPAEPRVRRTRPRGAPRRDGPPPRRAA